MPLPADAGSRLPAETSNTGKNEHTRARIFPTTWVAATAYAVGQYVRPTTANLHIYQVQSISGTGTSHATTEPTWPTTSGATVTDNAGANQIVWVESGSDQVHESYVVLSDPAGDTLDINSGISLGGTIPVTIAEDATSGSVGAGATGPFTGNLFMPARSGHGGFVVQITGTWAGNFSIEGTIDIATTSQTLVAQNTTTGALSTTISANGHYRIIAAQYTNVRFNATNVTSGTVSWYMRMGGPTASVSLGAALPNGTNAIGKVDISAAAAALADTTTNPTTSLVGALSELFNGTSWDRWRGNSNNTTGDTGSKGASFAGATQTNYNARGAYITVILGTVSGTSPTLACQLQWSPDGGTTWLTLGPALANLTATGQTGTIIAYPTGLQQSLQNAATAAGIATGSTVTLGLNIPLPRTWRINYTIGGTASPTFALSSVQVQYIL